MSDNCVVEKEPLRLTVAHNLSALRKLKGITQSELAAAFDYTDKSISKWEHGETLPDIETLVQLAAFYSVDMNYLVTQHENSEKEGTGKQPFKVNKIVVSILSISILWILAITAYIEIELLLHIQFWMVFVWATAISFIMGFGWTLIWKTKTFRLPISIGMVWTLTTAIYLQCGVSMADGIGWNLWMLFVLGVPLTAISILWNHIKS